MTSPPAMATIDTTDPIDAISIPTDPLPTKMITRKVTNVIVLPPPEDNAWLAIIEVSCSEPNDENQMPTVTVLYECKKHNTVTYERDSLDRNSMGYKIYEPFPEGKTKVTGIWKPLTALLNLQIKDGNNLIAKINDNNVTALIWRNGPAKCNTINLTNQKDIQLEREERPRKTREKKFVIFVVSWCASKNRISPLKSGLWPKT